MNVQETILLQARRIRVTSELSPEARCRLHKRRRRAPAGTALRAAEALGVRPAGPRELVQVHTTLITLYPGCQRVHVTARDVVSRKDVVAAYTLETSVPDMPRQYTGLNSEC